MDDLANLNAPLLKDRRVCVAGRLASMTHAELARLVAACGGEFLQNPRRTGFLLVMGDPVTRTAAGDSTGQTPSLGQTLTRARRLLAYGYPIEFLNEEQFLDQLGLGNSASAIRGPHTLSDLSRILEIPVVQLRRWLRAGLLRPVAEKYSLPYFDYHQVSFIKHLKELIDGGASLAAIRRGVERTQDLLPHRESLYDLWANIEHDGRVLLRLRDQLIDQTGQQYFDFEANADESPTLYAASIERGFHDLCDQALAFEADGRLTEARQTYERALELKPNHPTLHFDLGNVLFQLGQDQSALRAFQRATQLDPHFAMAWHNLGSVFAHRGDWPNAAAAFQRALELVPTYADSHFTLAEVLRQQGRPEEAAVHEQAFRTHSKAEILLTKRESFLRLVSPEDDDRRQSSS
jgi:tetratricopeptide (TPR) repeat protein